MGVRARRPNPDFLNIEEVEDVEVRAYEISAIEVRHHLRAYANALRVEFDTNTGLRIEELHNLRPVDLRNDGFIEVRMNENLKRHKPRLAAFVNGMGSSPTLARVREFIAWRGIGPEDAIWPSQSSAWWAWVRHRLGPHFPGQRRLTPRTLGATRLRWRLHPHALRAGWVMKCRRLPKRYGRKPMTWETIRVLGGWETEDILKRDYWWVDYDEVAEDVMLSMCGVEPTPQTAPLGRRDDAAAGAS